MKNRAQEAWVWYWGDENGIMASTYYKRIDNRTFTDYDEMKKHSAIHHELFKHNYKGYWSSYIKIEI